MIPMVRAMPSSAEVMPASARTQLVHSIMTVLPTSRAAEETREDMDWFMDWLMVSTSLVTRDRTSPVDRESR